MIIKICYQNMIHLLKSIPKSYDELIDQVQQTFDSKLPALFTLYYIDFEEDKISISSTADLELLLNEEL